MTALKKIIDKIGKDRLAILFLGGLLFLVVTIPVQENTKDAEDLYKRDRTNKSTLSLTDNRETDSEKMPHNLTAYDAYTVFLEKRLKDVLEEIQGAGKVSVLITLRDAGSLVVEKDFSYTRENFTKKPESSISETGSSYDDTQETVYTVNEDGEEIPFVAKEILPSIEGILIVAQGGDDGKVKNQMKQAVLSLFDLDEHKIAIVKMKSKSG